MYKAIETNNNTTMQNYYKTIGALVVASAFAASNASAEIESEIHAGYTSEYLFRGLNLGQDLVETGVDLSTEYNGFGLSAGAWYGSFSDSTGASFDELDLYGDVSKDLGFATASVGYIYYAYLGTAGADAQEVKFALAKSFYGVDFSLAWFWDIDLDNDGYTELAASKGFELSPCLTLSTSAVLGYLAEQSEFAHVTAKVALDYAYSETATISPFVAHSWSLTNEAGSTHANTDNELVAGTMLSVTF
jgi:uncharacterized protein (TIGR02001 family)